MGHEYSFGVLYCCTIEMSSGRPTILGLVLLFFPNKMVVVDAFCTYIRYFQISVNCFKQV